MPLGICGPLLLALSTSDWCLAGNPAYEEPLPRLKHYETNAGTHAGNALRTLLPPLGGPLSISCESEGTTDDRNTKLAGPTIGIGGLCTTGRNDATGEPQPASFPPMGSVTRLDVCAITIHVRNSGNFGPFGPAADCPMGANAFADCNLPPTQQLPTQDCTDHIAWEFEMGDYAFHVPTNGEVICDPTQNVLCFPNIQLTTDFAVYYEEPYAFWSYDGDGSYTPGDAIAAEHGFGGTADGFLLDNDGGPAMDNVDAWHGHAAMFIRGSNPAPPVLVGSAYTMTFPNWPAATAFSLLRYGTPGWADGVTFVSGPAPQEMYNQAGASPSDGFLSPDGSAGTYGPGPIVRAH